MNVFELHEFCKDTLCAGRYGASIYDVHKKIRFLTPPPVLRRPHEPDPLPLLDVYMQST